MPRDLAGRVGDVHDPGRRGAVLAAEDAVAEPEVQRGADHDDQVAAAERGPPRLGDEQRVAAGHDAAAHAVGDRGQPGLLDEAERGLLGAVGPDVGAEDQDRPGRAGQQPGDPADRVRVRVRAAGDAGGRRRAGRGVEELVHGHVDEDRAAVRGARGGEGLVHAGQYVGRRVQGPRQLRHRRDDRRLVELLQAAAAPAVGRGAAADDDHGRAGELRLRDRADAVGDARARGEHGEAGNPGQLAGRLGGEGGRLLVAHVEQPHRRVGLDRAVVHREDVRTGQREHGLDPVRAGDGDGELAGVPLDLGGLGRGEVGIAHGQRLPTGRGARREGAQRDVGRR